MSDVIESIRKRLRQSITDMDDMCQAEIAPKATGDFAADEDRLGFSLPPLLKRLYSEIGNGGFGPGYGLIGLTGGAPDDTGKTAPELHELFTGKDEEDPTWEWRRGLLPISHWGCAMYSCVDCSRSGFPMVLFDPNNHDEARPWSDALFDDCDSFDEWIADWAAGVNLWDRMHSEDGRIAKEYRRRNMLE